VAYCPECGAAVSDGAKFCSGCGSPVANSGASGTTDPAPAFNRAPQPAHLSGLGAGDSNSGVVAVARFTEESSHPGGLVVWTGRKFVLPGVGFLSTAYLLEAEQCGHLEWATPETSTWAHDLMQQENLGAQQVKGDFGRGFKAGLGGYFGGLAGCLVLGLVVGGCALFMIISFLMSLASNR
jgi:hypothetical protein